MPSPPLSTALALAGAMPSWDAAATGISGSSRCGQYAKPWVCVRHTYGVCVTGRQTGDKGDIPFPETHRKNWGERGASVRASLEPGRREDGGGRRKEKSFLCLATMRSKIIGNELIKIVGKYESRMVCKLPIIVKWTRSIYACYT